MKLITVFTPTYNRAKTLNKCYESLVGQTSNNFIWQIIDDGSTDGTEKIVQKFINEKKIDIVYIKKDNGGKCSAINKSLDVTETELWVCLDSDDYFFKNAIRIIEEAYPVIQNDEDVCGLFTLRSNSDGTPMYNRGIPKEVHKETQYNLRYKYHVEPEYVQIYKTNVINKYRYPLFDDEKYFPLSYMQDQIDRSYRFLIIREPIMVCEYRNDGITHNIKKLVKNNPKGYMAFKNQQIKFSNSIMFKIKACLAYDTGCIIAGRPKSVFESNAKCLSMVLFPLGFLNYLFRYAHV